MLTEELTNFAVMAYRFWSPVAKEYGWRIRHLTIWISEEGVVDSVALREGEFDVAFVDAATDNILWRFPLEWVV